MDSREEVDARLYRMDRALERRPIDTSTLGPIRIEPRRWDNARELYATKVAARGPAWRNAAESIRSGFSNVWIEAGIAAIESLLRRLGEDGHGRAADD